ncbi:IclR family transcriptional regulator [Micromonospora sp. 4G57]|uniref:IclR family transcriptional regulator n=1 Tax=Micromonospora sicca TaxID=2202420 RepID=A0ABU5J647_9ACTN|nr:MULTISPECIES: IclR family transcriptional regulator [unclassified Micromonospora]MDZ5443460.1 IclR family transcriptional regulator [Micromonospora sp. 4G57]MDZ5488040.1 IclR family transcriptional regulator [Micromonospora sp. 4G53]
MTESNLDLAADGPQPRGRVPGGVQSLERAFELLEIMADAGGVIGLSRLAQESGLALPTIHRLIRTLVDLGYVRQEPSRQYSLGPRLIRLGDSASHLLGTWSRPYLSRLVDALGESANLAMLDGDRVVYVAQVQSRQSMRMFTEVGRRVYPHCTAVGKALLAHLPPIDVHTLLERTGMPAQTEHTITEPRRFAEEIDRVRAQGYAMDDGEQEIGVRCVAVPVLGIANRLAVSVSGPAPRMTPDVVERAVPLLRQAAEDLADELSVPRSAGPDRIAG